MELLLLTACGMLLYAAGNYVDHLADQMAGEAFDHLHEVSGGVSYFGQAAKPVHKTHVSHVTMPLFPSIHHDLKVLCKTDCGHWFWFHACIKTMKLDTTDITPITSKEAFDALREYPDKQTFYFPSATNDQEKETSV